MAKARCRHCKAEITIANRYCESCGRPFADRAAGVEQRESSQSEVLRLRTSNWLAWPALIYFALAGAGYYRWLQKTSAAEPAGAMILATVVAVLVGLVFASMALFARRKSPAVATLVGLITAPLAALAAVGVALAFGLWITVAMVVVQAGVVTLAVFAWLSARDWDSLQQ